MKKTIIVIPVILISSCIFGQIEDNSEIKEKFSYEIVQIEEFIERFNFDNNTKLLKYLKENHPDLVTDRKKFMNTLFDGRYLNKNKPQVNEFIDFVCDSAKPLYLNFYDNSWYAEVSCIFEYQNKVDSGKLVLVNQFEADSSSKWVIVGASSNLLQMPESQDTMRIMSPVSHGTGFIALYNVFKDGKNVQNYIRKDYQPDELTYLMALMYLNKIKLLEVSGTRYYFLQIPNWAFTIDYLNRSGLNTGWLITNLEKINQNEKDKYRRQILKVKDCE